MLVSRFKYFVAAVTTITLLASCAGGSPTPTTPLAVQQNQTRARKHTTNCPCVYVTNWNGGYNANGSVTVYAAGATGNATPVQNLGGTYTDLDYVNGIAVDGSGNMYVTNEFSFGSTSSGGTVTVYAAGATGNVPPTSMISGPNTGLDNPWGIALDPINGDIYVANNSGSSVTIYAPGANGDASPIGTIEGRRTKLSSPVGIALDASGNIYVSNLNNTVNVYAAGSIGDVRPLRTISNPSSKVNMDGPFQLTLDSSTNTYIANEGNFSVVNYAAGASGRAKPTRTIAGSKTDLDYAYGIALDGNDNIYVANYEGGPSGEGSITVYAPGTKKDAKPFNIISGSNTGLVNPRAIVIR